MLIWDLCCGSFVNADVGVAGFQSSAVEPWAVQSWVFQNSVLIQGLLKSIFLNFTLI
jgi:hypothetical protein